MGASGVLGSPAFVTEGAGAYIRSQNGLKLNAEDQACYDAHCWCCHAAALQVPPCDDNRRTGVAATSAALAPLVCVLRHQ